MIQIAIDGPAGTGKGTITKLVAQEMGLCNIDTGAMYRSITLQCIRQGITSINQKEKMIEINGDYLELTQKGIALIIDVQRCFETENNLSYTQPQYNILDMFEGQRETYDLEVIEHEK